MAGRGGIGSIELCLCVFGLRFEALLLVSLRLFHALDVDGQLDLLVECNRVDLRIEAVIVSTQGVEDLPDHAEARVVIEGLGRGDSRRDGDGQDDIAVVLALGFAHDAADGLDDVDHGIARVEEDDAIEGGDVHALGETASVGKDASLVLRDGGLEPRDLIAALEGVHGAIDVLDGDLEIDVEQADVVGCRVVLELLLVLADERGEGLLDSLRSLDVLGEGNGAAHGLCIGLEAGLRVLLGARTLRESVPRADHG